MPPPKTIPGLTDCAAKGQVYDIDKDACVPPPTVTAIDVIGPLIGTTGTIIDPDTIEESMKGSGTDKDDKDESKKDSCNSGISAAGCDDGKRLCSLIPGGHVVPQDYHEAGLWMLLAIGVLFSTRRRLHTQ